jgi:hypothetical protein
MTTQFPIGWVLRASTVGFAVGCRILQPNTPHFGDLVKVPGQPNGIDVFGLIYNVEVRDDPAVRQLILVGEMEPEAVLDQRENRLVPIELSVLAVGYQQGKSLIQGLPPQPPLSLDMLTVSDELEVIRFTENLDYLRLVLNSAQIPSDELLVANLRRATLARSADQQYPFLLRAGRELARLLNTDLTRLEAILHRLKTVISQ